MSREYADELVPVETVLEIQQDRNLIYDELVALRRVTDHLHRVLYDNDIVFRCECDRRECYELRVYFDTVKESRADD